MVTVKTTFNESDEANYVAGDILMGVNRGRNFRDTAVLYRMNAQSNALEYAMKRLGLVVIRPQRGDTFQNDVHTLTTTSSETINVPEFAKIDQCITPGVLAERADLRFREVIVPAVVTLMVD